MERLGEQGSAIPKLEEARTTDIESEEVDIFERKSKFEELLKRMEKHRKETLHLRGNDLRYNIYMKKLSKLTRMDLGLDVEAYKDYINNLKQFAAVNTDFGYFAMNSLASGNPDDKEMIKIEFNKVDGNGNSIKAMLTKEEMKIFSERCDEIYNVLRKLKREGSAFITKRDRALVKEF